MHVTGHRPTPFVVFTTPRTGSSWLVELLDTHPRVVTYGELFYPGRHVRRDNGSSDFPRFDDLPTRVVRRSGPLAALELEAYVRALFRERSGIQAVGLKVMLEQARAHPRLVGALGARRARAIHLVRQNTLARLISLRAAIERGSFRPRRGESIPTVTIALDTDVLVRDLETMAAAVSESRELLAQHGLPYLELPYERLVEGTGRELARVAAFLDLEETTWSARSTLAVTNPDPLALVENLDEVRRTLSGTRFEGMLTVDGSPPVPA